MNQFLATKEPRKVVASSHEEWLSLRQGIGSSEIGTLLGVNPWQTPYQLWHNKVHPQPEQNSFLMEMGHRLEPVIADLWASRTGKSIVQGSEEEYIYVHPDKPYLSVSPDREFVINGKSNGILECKSTQHIIDAASLPEYWFCQVQYQLGVAQLEHANIAWLTQGREFNYAEIEFNPEFFAFMIDKVDDFMNNYVIPRVEPEVTNIEDVAMKYQYSMDKSFEASQELLDRYTELKEIRNSLNALTDKKKELEDAIKMSMLDADRLMYNGTTLATWKSAKDSVTFDIDAFKAENPELYEKYLKTKSGSRRFLIK